MNKEQQEKLAQVLLEESLTCADRNDLERCSRSDETISKYQIP